MSNGVFQLLRPKQKIMDIKQLDQDLINIALQRNKLSKLDYNDASYDDAEEALHDLEDDFLEKYTDYLEKAFQSVHDEFCPENDVLLPIAYIAKKYIEKKDDKGNLAFGVGPGEGVMVEVEQYLDRDVRLVLVPAPVRIILVIDQSHSEIVWEAK